uniref:Uncharacterized protein n=1 Tax=Anguilla anguilla TaxID=7936 RepID=A0A0E9XJD5_ANGAN
MRLEIDSDLLINLFIRVIAVLFSRIAIIL